jgi:hypothetical protein
MNYKQYSYLLVSIFLLHTTIHGLETVNVPIDSLIGKTGSFRKQLNYITKNNATLSKNLINYIYMTMVDPQSKKASVISVRDVILYALNSLKLNSAGFPNKILVSDIKNGTYLKNELNNIKQQMPTTYDQIMTQIDKQKDYLGLISYDEAHRIIVS